MKNNGSVRQLHELARRGTNIVLGVYSAYSALLAEKAGCKVAYLSGAALSGSLALPDLGIITPDELVSMTRAITRIIRIPLIVDADTGFGEIYNVMRITRELEASGASAIQIEDQEMPKKCGHIEGKRVVEPIVMVQKIKAALKARRNKNFLIVARTDARSTHGLGEAIKRANLYVRAGADIIFPEALESELEFREFAEKVRAPLLANMTEFGKSPLLSVSQLAKLGYRFVLFPVTLFRAASFAINEAARTVLQKGTQKSLLARMQSREDFYKTIGYREYDEIDRSIAREAEEEITSQWGV